MIQVGFVGVQQASGRFNQPMPIYIQDADADQADEIRAALRQISLHQSRRWDDEEARKCSAD